MICDGCDNDFKRIGSHWSQSDCGYPKFSEKQKELLKGLLMGDGTVTEEYGTGRMTIEMTSEPFLNWVDEQLGVFSTGVSLKHTAEEKVEKAKESGFFDTINEDEWSDSYVLKTRRHPYFKRLRDSWYTENGKRFPRDITLTPLLTKAWYAGDGTLHHTRGNPNVVSKRAKFVTRNESDDIDFIQGLFDDLGFDARKRSDGVTLTVSSTEDLCEWMGEAPPGMDYKWV